MVWNEDARIIEHVKYMTARAEKTVARIMPDVNGPRASKKWAQ